MKNFYFLLAGIFLFVSQGMAQQSLLDWNFYGSDGKGATYTATLNDMDLEVSEVSRGAGAPGLNGNSNGFSAALVASADLNEAKTNETYFEFTVKAKSGSSFSLSAINSNIRTQTYSAKTYQWFYSIDNAEFVAIASPVTVNAAEVDVNNGVAQASIDVSGVADLQNVASSKTVKMRLYAWGGTTPAETDPNPTYVNFGFGKSTAATGNYTPSLAIKGSMNVRALATVAAWDFSGQTENVTSGDIPATSLSQNVNSAKLSRGTGFTPGSFRYAYASVTEAKDSKENAKAGNAYYLITTKSDASYSLSLTSLNYKFRRTSTAPSSYRWEYSTDGSTFTEIGNADESLLVSSNGEAYKIDLSSVSDLQNVSADKTITLRMLVWGGTSATAVFGFGRDVVNSIGTPGALTVYLKGKTDFSNSINTESVGASNLNVIALDDAVKVICNQANNETAQVKIYDLTGRTLFASVVYLENDNNEIILPVNLSKGTYILSLNNQTVKFTK